MKCLKCGGDSAVCRTEKNHKGWAHKSTKRTYKCKSCASEFCTRETYYDGKEAMAEHVDRSRNATMGIGLSSLSKKNEELTKKVKALERELRLRARTPAAIADGLHKAEMVAVHIERQAQARHRVEDHADQREIERLVSAGY